MRIIGGLYRGRRLAPVPGLDVRPTSDRLRETLFNILAPVAEGARFLDLCAGTGAVGIEALSRGARHVTFVEQSVVGCAIIQRNLAAVRVTETALVLRKEAAAALRYLEERGEMFDLIFFDPPYSSQIYSPVMNLISKSRLLPEDGIVIVEHRSKSQPEPDYNGLTVFRRVKQGESQLAFYHRLASAST